MGATPRMIINLFVLTNIVDASKAVSKALGVPKKYRNIGVTWILLGLMVTDFTVSYLLSNYFLCSFATYSETKKNVLHAWFFELFNTMDLPKFPQSLQLKL